MAQISSMVKSVRPLLLFLLLLHVSLLLTHGQTKVKQMKKAGDDGWKEKGVNADGRKVTELKIAAPTMTEEDQYGYNMPDRYNCDACRAVAFHLNETLTRRHPKSRPLKEWEYTELFDHICANDFSGYGIKLVGGQNVLSGPALKHNEQSLAAGGATIQMGGENWSKRMGEICRKFVYDKIGEEDLYKKFRADGELSESACWTQTRDCSFEPQVTPKDVKDDKEEKKEKREKKEAKEAKAKEKTQREKKKREKKATSEPGRTAQPAKDDEAFLKRAAEKAKGSREKTAGSAPWGGYSGTLDAATFLAQLAEKHGLSPKEYTANRSGPEWERLIVAAGGRIFNSLGEEAAAEEVLRV